MQQGGKRPNKPSIRYRLKVLSNENNPTVETFRHTPQKHRKAPALSRLQENAYWNTSTGLVSDISIDHDGVRFRGCDAGILAAIAQHLGHTVSERTSD